MPVVVNETPTGNGEEISITSSNLSETVVIDATDSAGDDVFFELTLDEAAAVKARLDAEVETISKRVKAREERERLEKLLPAGVKFGDRVAVVFTYNPNNAYLGTVTEEYTAANGYVPIRFDNGKLDGIAARCVKTVKA